MRQSFLFLLFILVFASCKQVDCECAGSYVTIFFEETDGSCNPVSADNLTITEYSPELTLRETDPLFDIISDCQIFLRLDEEGVWIFESDQLGIQDTLEITGIDFVIDSPSTCNCEPAIIGTQALLNGEYLEDTEFRIVY